MMALPDQPQDGEEEGPGYRIPGPDNSLWQKMAPDSLMTAPEIVEGFAGPDRLGLLGDGLFYHRDSFDPSNRHPPERYWSPRAPTSTGSATKGVGRPVYRSPGTDPFYRAALR
jgi:hypothetical protein